MSVAECRQQTPDILRKSFFLLNRGEALYSGGGVPVNLTIGDDSEQLTG